MSINKFEGFLEISFRLQVSKSFCFTCSCSNWRRKWLPDRASAANGFTHGRSLPSSPDFQDMVSRLVVMHYACIPEPVLRLSTEQPVHFFCDSTDYHSPYRKVDGIHSSYENISCAIYDVVVLVESRTL